MYLKQNVTLLFCDLFVIIFHDDVTTVKMVKCSSKYPVRLEMTRRRRQPETKYMQINSY